MSLHFLNGSAVGHQDNGVHLLFFNSRFFFLIFLNHKRTHLYEKGKDNCSAVKGLIPSIFIQTAVSAQTKGTSVQFSSDVQSCTTI